MGEESSLLLARGASVVPKRYFPRRFLIVFLCWMSLVLCYSYRVILSVAVIPMADEYGYSHATKGLVLSSFFWGYIFTQMPAGFLCDRYGGKMVLGLGVTLAGVLTMFTPLVSHSLPLLLALRCLTGLVEGVAYPSVHWLLANWAHENERSRFVTFIWGGGYVGTVISMLVSPVLINKFHWPSVFYSSGALGIVWGVCWAVFAASTPRQHRFIHDSEVLYLTAKHHSRVGSPIKFSELGKLLRSVHVWAIICDHFGSNWGFYILLTWLPTYMNQKLDFDMSKSAFLSVLPFLTMAFTAFFGGLLADLLLTLGLKDGPKGINSDAAASYSGAHAEALAARKTFVRKLFGAVGLGLACLSFIAINYVRNAYVALLCIVIALGGTGLTISGYGVNHLDIAPRYAGLLMGMSNTAATLPGIFGVYLTGIMTWPEVFFVGAGVYAFSVVVWLLFATGRQLFY